MAKSSEFFTSLSDIDIRPAFSPDHEVGPDNFKQLVGAYHLEEEAICQVKARNGICHQKHRKGWLGVTLDGHEVLIGGHCARNYFKADKTFALERNRVSKEIERVKALHKLSKYQGNAALLSAEIATLRQTLIDTRVNLASVYKLLPNSAQRHIENAQRTRNWDIRVDVQQENLHEQKHRWIAITLGRLKPVPYMYEVIGLMNKVKELSETFTDVGKCKPDEIATPKLKRILDILSQKEELEKASASLYKEVIQFINAKNLEMLVYVADDSEEEYLTVKAIMDITGAKVSSEGHVNLRLRRIKERTAIQLGATEVRKNQLIDRLQRSRAFSS
ncbi:hypothetical protein [Serratia plymuthica]|uniref:hypothetical protein n=1 Tax=Serratia plymuthica TaxID=82996 RepID=UPI0005672C8E|nr:hypothetical protein [Serratia plymuthica]